MLSSIQAGELMQGLHLAFNFTDKTLMVHQRYPLLIWPSSEGKGANPAHAVASATRRVLHEEAAVTFDHLSMFEIERPKAVWTAS